MRDRIGRDPAPPRRATPPDRRGRITRSRSPAPGALSPAAEPGRLRGGRPAVRRSWDALQVAVGQPGRFMRRIDREGVGPGEPVGQLRPQIDGRQVGQQPPRGRPVGAEHVGQRDPRRRPQQRSPPPRSAARPRPWARSRASRRARDRAGRSAGEWAGRGSGAEPRRRRGRSPPDRARARERRTRSRRAPPPAAPWTPSARTCATSPSGSSVRLRVMPAESASRPAARREASL